MVPRDHLSSAEQMVSLIVILSSLKIIDYEEAYKSSDVDNDAGNITRINDEFEVQNSLAHEALAALFGTIACIQLLVVITLHVLTVVHRNHSSVKASSPKLSHIAYVGIYLLVIMLLLTSINEHPTFSQKSKSFTLSSKMGLGSYP